MTALITTALTAWSDHATGLFHDAECGGGDGGGGDGDIDCHWTHKTDSQAFNQSVSQSVSQSLDQSVFAVCWIMLNFLYYVKAVATPWCLKEQLVPYEDLIHLIT